VNKYKEEFTMTYDSKKLKGLFQRVYENKMVKDVESNTDDDRDIREYCSKVFGNGSKTPDPSLLH
jgi:hypothetical protein